jgi:hypothetical protein
VRKYGDAGKGEEGKNLETAIWGAGDDKGREKEGSMRNGGEK